ncbi:hypothetical protein FJQ54_02465 [Sandaracinobacter neustonicus]|uniref:Membrane protein YkvI n=1 Tax=Sandaracinobacter neustonicus TaxID=1715348 RepID=A0A501XTF3_9SPHN|nr:hypothetical protein [Sandaracinobacter neustonicus]TPE63735.1 hypothetical protein FJQ54_02465 [Sandaracinobacter neustonicus]
METGSAPERHSSSWFERRLLPGFAFKAVIIGGGYATGRELAEFFGPSGARGGLYGMLVAMAVWSVICALTFLYARSTGTRDYRSFFRHLLGPFWPLFEIVLLSLFVLVLAVFSAAAGAIGAALFGAPPIAGQLALMISIAGFVAFGSESVERLFKWVSFVLYATYAVFLALSIWRFGDQIVAELSVPAQGVGWIGDGLSYAGYNVIGAVVILYVVRHFSTPRDAVLGGILCGPLAMLPAMLFFLALAAVPAAMQAELPSDYLLERLNVPFFPYFYQFMIFLALLESGAGAVHSINERIGHVVERSGRSFGVRPRLGVAIAALIFTGFVAQSFGLVALIASGYRYISYAVLAVFVVPMLTLGVWRLWQWRRLPGGMAPDAGQL